MTRTRHRRTWAVSTELELQWVSDRSYWLGFRTGAIAALVAVILLGLGYLVVAP